MSYEEWLQYPKSQEEMRNNKFYKDGRNFIAKTVDGDYCPGTLDHKKRLHSKFSKFLLKILNYDWSGQFHGSQR